MIYSFLSIAVWIDINMILLMKFNLIIVQGTAVYA